MVADEGFENWETFFKNKIDVHKTTESPNVGAWIVTKPNTGETWEFERNPYYYAVDPAGNQLPYVDKIEARLYSDNEVHNLRGIAGEYDFNHRAIEFAKLPVFIENQEKGNYRMILWPGDATLAVAFNYSYGLGDVTEEPDPEIRKWITNKQFKQAMSHAVNRPKINELLYFGTGEEVQPTFPKWSAHYPGEEIAKRYTQYDPDLANEILDEVGLTEKDGEGFRLRTDGSGDRLAFILDYSSGWTPTNNPAELLKEAWAAVGIDIRLNPVEGTIGGERRGGNVQHLNLDGDVNAREPTGLISGRAAFPAYTNWYSQRTGSYTLGAVVAEPAADDTAFWRLVEAQRRSGPPALRRPHGELHREPGHHVRGALLHRADRSYGFRQWHDRREEQLPQRAGPRHERLPGAERLGAPEPGERSHGTVLLQGRPQRRGILG